MTGMLQRMDTSTQERKAGKARRKRLFCVQRAETNAYSFALKQKRRHSGGYETKDIKGDKRASDVLLRICYTL